MLVMLLAIDWSDFLNDAAAVAACALLCIAIMRIAIMRIAIMCIAIMRIAACAGIVLRVLMRSLSRSWVTL